MTPKAPYKPALAKAGVCAWLGRHQRFHFHFTPTSASLAQRGRGLLRQADTASAQTRRLKGIADLQAAINRFLQETNANPKPFLWTADPDAIIEKVRRGKQVLGRSTSGSFVGAETGGAFAGTTSAECSSFLTQS